MKKKPVLLMALGVVLSFTALLRAQEDTLRVGLYPTPPFTIQEVEQGDTLWSGICVELIREMYAQRPIVFQSYSVTGIDEMMEGVHQGRLDLGMGALSVTSERLNAFYFSQPYYSSAVSIAHPQRGVYWSFFNWKTFWAVAWLVGILVLFGLVHNLMERKPLNKERGLARGVLNYLVDCAYFGGVVMSTVGFGDIVPTRKSTRVLSLFFIFISAIVMANFYAELASAKTLAGIKSGIDNLSDLKKMKVACVDGTYAARLLHEKDVRFVNYKNIDNAFDDMMDGDLDAVVYDRPRLEWLIKDRDASNIGLDPKRYEPQSYAFVLGQKSGFNRDCNQRLVRTMESADWNDLLDDYGLDY